MGKIKMGAILILLVLTTGCTNLLNMYKNSKKVTVLHNGQVAVMTNADQVTFKFIDKMQKYLSRNGSIWVEVPHKPNKNDGKSLDDFVRETYNKKK